ncbi:MAG: S41 family peptidase [Lachnospiraceae bacterium]|jgi:carboxyl-terminal processing protease|nr:S41 family peptidase [Lachnospiraceae bacterium]MCI9356079.1 S41 family peptidase [Lachnospiraceae bacterium]
MENRGKFLKGFILGLLLMSLISAGGFYAYTSGAGLKGKRSLAGRETMEKINYLEDLIDLYYLNGPDQTKMKEGMYAGLVDGLEDPYSRYYTAEEYSALNEETQGRYEGIGVVMQQNEDGLVTFVRCYEGAPGEQAGLKAGDILYKVNDQEVTDMDLSTVAKKIKDPDINPVHLTMIREGENDYLEINIEKEEVKIPVVSHEMLDNQVGYLAIYEFTDVTFEQYQKAKEDLESQGMEKLVIDLRDNPGGLLTSVCDVLGTILPKGLIVYTEDKYGKREEELCDGKTPIDIPLAVLVNGNSASASEIFAGAVKDHKMGTIVGTTTYGKGVVQTIRDLGDGSALKLTVSNYYTPNGVNINGVGIEPDVKEELDKSLQTGDTVNKEDDNQLQKAIEVLME